MTSQQALKILLVLQGSHRYSRGAEVAFENIAQELGHGPDQVTLIGGGPPRVDSAYDYIQVPHRGRERFERWPTFPPFRDATLWEQADFVRKMARLDISGYDITVTCSYPFVNWLLRMKARPRHAPPHVYVTENSDWPARRSNSEYRLFGCDGLVCTNPEYFDRHTDSYQTALIPNGIDARFVPGPGDRERLGLHSGPVVLMVSALIPSKRVIDGVKIVSSLPGVQLLVAGDGPDREAVDRAAGELLPGRYSRVQVSADEMPLLYRSSDVLLHLAAQEAFGNIYLEAAACGVPVVAVDNPAVRWILGDTRGLVTRFDADELAAALRDALMIGRDSVVDQRSLRCRQDFAWPNIAASYREFLASVVASHR